MTSRDRSSDDLFPDLVDLAAAEGEPPVPSPGLRERVLASLVPGTRFAGFEERLAQLFDLPLARVRELGSAIERVADAPWDDDVVPGVRLLHFAGGERCARAHCGIVHVAPGAVYPRHRHARSEWSFVLSGCAEDLDTGRRLAPGDLAEQPAGSAHAFRALGDEPYVFAVLLWGPIEFV